jgi:hypothetical protein
LSWSDEFDDPIPGLRTLQDTADHILKLPNATLRLPHWQAAVEALIMAAEDRGPLLHARVGMLRAITTVGSACSPTAKRRTGASRS